jgi:tocopherol cyclase
MALLYPPSFQGSFKKNQYFEGWFCKHVTPLEPPATTDHQTIDVTRTLSNPVESTTLAVIPGISLGKDPHSFIQVNIASGPESGKSWYIRYPLEAADLNKKTFSVRIGTSAFSLNGMTLHIDEKDIHIHGRIGYQNPREFPVSLVGPGIMGWYRYVPAMECYHGLVSAHHELSGRVTLQSADYSGEFDFTGGDGYIEKDWGKSFPSSWIWMQANSFQAGEQSIRQSIRQSIKQSIKQSTEESTEKSTEESQTPNPVSFMLSLARIPWIGKSFPGFLGYVYYNNTYYPFATYTGARLEQVRVDHHQVTALVKARGFTLSIDAKRDDGAELIAPVAGAMTRTIKESIGAVITLTLEISTGETWEGTSHAAGLEVSGDMGELGVTTT